MNLFLAPHSDDETLWGAFTLIREKPLVVIVTDSYVQQNRGESITAEQRWEETVAAMKILDCPVVRLGVRDDILHEEVVRYKLSTFANFDRVYAPAIQGGNPQHDIVGKIADELFPHKVLHYTTYTKDEPYTTGAIEIVPITEAIKLKNKALAQYKSQLGNNNRLYFDAVRGKSEWLC